jgi:D-glycero-D-manno-heptose 1,7-bisphosphate phosphatase
MKLNKCVFLDRDGVLNEDRVNYAYDLAHFKILPGVTESLVELKKAGYLLIVITNQSGIAQGIYSKEQMQICHDYLQTKCNHTIDQFYYAPLHPSVSESLMRKPNSLMFEKAIAKFKIDISQSWMIGDKDRDIIPAKHLGINTILVGNLAASGIGANYLANDLYDATKFILNQQK